MPVFSGISTFVLQSSDLSRHDIHLAMWFLGGILVALGIQAAGVVFAALFAARLLHRVEAIANIVEQKTGPILDQTTRILTDLTPKIQSFTENAEQISYTVRTKVDELGVTISHLNETVQEINGRSRIQIARADGIVTTALIATGEIAVSVEQSIKAPVRQIAGVIAGLKAGIETLIARSPFGR